MKSNCPVVSRPDRSAPVSVRHNCVCLSSLIIYPLDLPIPINKSYPSTCIQYNV